MDNELSLGFMSTQSLCDWFGIKVNTYNHTKSKKLEELTRFAEYSLVKGGVYITLIKIPVYAKKGSRAYEIIRENFEKAWHKSGYDTAARAGSQIWYENEELQNLISEETAKTYLSKIKLEYYGKAYDPRDYGTRGACYYTYVAKNGWEEAILLTQKQEEIIKQVRSEVYSKANEQEVFLLEAYAAKEITKEERDAGLAEWSSPESRYMRYEEYRYKVFKILGFYPDRVTFLENYTKGPIFVKGE